jgi:hypothetical protein
MPAYPEHLLFLLVDACLTDLRSGGHEMLAATKAAALLVEGGIHPSSLCLWICETDVGHVRHDGSVNSGPRAASRLLRLLLLRAYSKVVRIEDLLRFFYICFALIFENKWSNQKFLEIYIWRHTPTAVRHDVRGCQRSALLPGGVRFLPHDGSRNPSAVTHGGRSPIAMGHGDSVTTI